MVALLILALSLVLCSTEHFAVIVSGSKGFWNYRHQSDVCHSYHTLKDHGVPAQNIILMMYNDVAYSEDNPLPGSLYNAPGENSVNYYENCVVDYQGEHLTTNNFLNVLTGNSQAMQGLGTGRVLRSGPEDHVFLNFVDHGATGMLSFPTTELYAHQLLWAFRTMKAKGMYKYMVMYVEACESGSMFDGLLQSDLNVFAVTASNAVQPSWGTYCPPDDSVNGVRLYTCLGDLFSVN